jgi:YidC/Oxa1 family membrane protein insertase
LKKDENGDTTVSKWTLLVPVFSVVLGFLQTKISQKSNNMTEEQLQQQKTMNFMMPILLGYTAYIMPVALGVYWLLGNILGIVSQLLINFMLKDRKIMIGEGEKK